MWAGPAFVYLVDLDEELTAIGRNCRAVDEARIVRGQRTRRSARFLLVRPNGLSGFGR